MSDQDHQRQALIDEIQRRLSYLLSTEDYTVEEKEEIARRFFQALHQEEQDDKCTKS